jgi:hypothetical protein
MSSVSIEKLEKLLGHTYDSANDTNLVGDVTKQVHLVVEYFGNSTQGLSIGIRVGNDPMRLLGRITEFSAHATPTGNGTQSFKVVTKSRECADILSMFYPLTHVIFEPISLTMEPTPWGPLVVPEGTSWRISSDYDVLGIMGGVNAVLSLRNKKTNGIIEVPITADMENLIPSLV